MRKEIIVIDGFYQDPDKIREEALEMDFGVSGNYPGKRTTPLTGGDVMEFLERVLDIEIDEMDWEQGDYTGTYQYTTVDETTWVHADRHSDLSCIVYLHPDPAENTGTSFYTHKETGSRSYWDDDGESIEKDGAKPEKWIRRDTVGNVYNRAVVFEGDLWHAADDYFGDSLENGRLFQTFFFNKVKE
jgi:hypothetical protein